MATASYAVIRLSEDAAGESHFDEYDVAQHEKLFAPPAPPFLVSPVAGASGYVVVRIPVAWIGERHPSPQRQILFCMAGVLRVTASDGDVRDIGPGDIWLMTDTTGKGHASDVVSDVAFDAVIVAVTD